MDGATDWCRLTRLEISLLKGIRVKAETFLYCNTRTEDYNNENGPELSHLQCAFPKTFYEMLCFPFPINGINNFKDTATVEINMLKILSNGKDLILKIKMK